jgi:hypothetical protein
LLRAPAGTTVRVTLRNTLGVQLVVFGLQDHGAQRGVDSVTLAAGAQTPVVFREGHGPTHRQRGTDV